MRCLVFLKKIVVTYAVFISFLVSNLLAIEDSELSKHKYVNNLIWGSGIINSDTASKELRKDNAYQRICDLYDEHMFVASPFKTSILASRNLYEEDNNFYPTPVFGFLTDFWGRPMWDHAALLCEHYDNENKKISANMYHLTMRDDWEMGELIYKFGYGYRGYKIEEEDKQKIVEIMMCHPKYKSKHVRYHPYKTFRVAKTEKTIGVLAKLKQLSQEEHYSYSLYGSRSANKREIKGKHNCISFITNVLWQFGVFQDKYTLSDILKYSNAYPLESLSPYSRLHGLTRRLIRVPETLKHLIDNNAMIDENCLFKVHQAALMVNHRPVREGNAYGLVNDVLKRNIANAILESNGLIGVNTQVGDAPHNAKELSEMKEEAKDDIQPSASIFNDGNSHAKIPGNINSLSGVSRFGLMLLRRFR